MAENTKEGAPAGGKKKSKMGLIIILAVVLLLGGGGAFMFLGKGKKAEAPAAEGEKVEEELAADAKGGHGEAKKEEGGGHGEAKAEGGHGEAKKEEGGGHGEAKPAGGHGEAAAAGGAEASEGEEPLIYDFEKPFTINLLDPTGRQFVQMTILLEANSPDGLKEIELHKAPLRDATNTLIASKRREDIQVQGGSDRLKRELMARYEGILQQSTVQNIYITEMVFMRQ